MTRIPSRSAPVQLAALLVELELFRRERAALAERSSVRFRPSRSARSMEPSFWLGTPMLVQ